MRIADFDYNLPKELIAQYPAAKRSASRLLCLDKDSGNISHKQFTDLPRLLFAKDLLIFNDTRVIPARLFGVKATGGKVEILVERILDEHTMLAHVKASKPPKIGCKLIIEKDFSVKVISRRGDLFELKFVVAINILHMLKQIGHMPLPPYITRPDEFADYERYQTVFARHEGAVAAPTAGLHFDDELLCQVPNKGFITLHVGAGTFQPVRVDDIEQHEMHTEFAEVTATVCEQITATKKKGGRIIAVGTTCVRSLETLASSGEIKPFKGETNIFIYPGFKFQCVDALITNFHMPKSTLLMLVSAFAGLDNIMNAYQEAINEQYRFFSYGDAMLIS